MPDPKILEKLEAAKLATESADAKLAALSEELQEAYAARVAAEQEAELLHAQAYAAEIAKAKADTEANEKRHRAECKKHCEHIEARKAAHAPADHQTLMVVKIDGKVHQIVRAHGLLHGHHGFAGSERREASRYYTAEGYSIDAAHDELAHERFDQTQPVDCPICLELAGAVTSDYLTADEHIAMVRAEQKRKNAASSAPNR
jgi:hypothetical protein